MNTRRRSTAHDHAALRLHPDGSRVLNSNTNLSARRANNAVRDSRRNWIARDAGGLGTIKKRRARARPDEGRDDDHDTEAAEDVDIMEEVQPSISRDKGKGRARDSDDEVEEVVLNPRAQKRLHFTEDFSFLASRSSSAFLPLSDGEHLPSQPKEPVLGPFPTPSSDMLKCIHYFASTYYTAMGQLYDASRESRKQRKLRRARKVQKAGSNSGSLAPSAEAEEVLHFSDLDSSEDSQVEDENEQPEKAASSSMKARKQRPKELRLMEKDMYRVCDGSALIALGMLLQEHVAETLRPNIPDGWEKEMALIERDMKAEEKKAQKAETMRAKRHVKKESSEPPLDFESEDEYDSRPAQVGRHQRKDAELEDSDSR